jgi:hypothetical protein
MLQKINRLILVVWLLLYGNYSFGQYSESQFKKNCPQERIQLHLSHTSVFTGELCWFKVYCSSPLYPDREISTLAFVELIGSNNASILRKRILLNHGEGEGEFEIPENLPTGLYHILAYTNWLKNFGEESFFSCGLAIINPSQSIVYNTDSSELKDLKNIATGSTGYEKHTINIVPNKKEFSTRERVNLKIEKADRTGKSIAGHLSVSVYRKEPAMIYSSGTDKEKSLTMEPEQIRYLPDYRGIRLTGKLSDHMGNAVANANVIASLPGPGTDIRNDITDSDGNFNFLLSPRQGDHDIIITMADASTKISLEESFWNGFRNPPSNIELKLNQEIITYLKEKYMHFQLQSRFKNQYYVRNAPLMNPKDSSVFYSKPYQFLKMDDYISLDSLREYFYELIPSVKFTQRRGEIDISVIDPLTSLYFKEEAGVFIDGVLYDNYKEVVNIPVEEISWITVLPNIYYYKDFTFGGIVDIHTKKSDFSTVILTPKMTRFLYPLANASEWKFTPPDYSIADPRDRKPDFRYLLHWEPNVKIEESEEASIEFYTGDITGYFVIKVVGISEEGDILSAENEIYVKQ